MRKLLFIGVLITSMMLSFSCSNEDLNAVSSTDEISVNFSLGLDGFMSTRAGSSLDTDKLVYSLFDNEGKLLENIGDAGMVVKNNAFAAGEGESISISLLKGQTYTIVFWAQNSSCNAYTVTAEQDGLKVDVDYEGANNDETRDAFFASETFTVEGDAAIDVVLKRPFAQINLGVTSEDWDAAIASGISVTKSKAIIKNAATSINLLDGNVTGEAVVVYDFANIPTVETRSTSDVKDLQVGDESYKWLSMSYILTDESKSTLDSDGLQFALETSKGDEIIFNEGLHNVPVQRNWRTNIVGNVLTGETTFNVVVDPIYYSTATVNNVNDFKAALNDSNIQVIKLEPGEYDLIHVLNKKGISVIESADPANPATIKGILAVAARADNVTFKNLKFDVSDNSTKKTGHQYLDRYERRSIVPIYAAQVTFDGCSFVNLYDNRSVVAINYYAHAVGKKLTVNNCSFQGYAYTIYSRALLTVTNSTFDQYHSDVNPRAIFLYGLGDGSKGNVIFKNNKAIGKTSYALQLSSTTFPYGEIEFDVQNNQNFSVDGMAYLAHPDLDFSGVTFADGSDTF